MGSFLGPLDVVLSRHDVVEPDVMVVLADQAAIVTDKHIQGAPAILIEVLSPETRQRDERAKRSLYARVGVREYWMVDPDSQLVTVCRSAAASTLETVKELSGARDDALASSMLPGFSVAVREQFVVA